MDDGQRETTSELKAAAAADQAAFCSTCEECGKLVEGTYSDMDIHLRDECEALGWPSFLDDLFGDDDAENAA